MKRVLALVLALALASCAGTVLAAVPETMSYQGVLTDALGAPVANGFYDLTFRLYDAQTGGTLLWTEAQTGVALTGGGFSVLLGSVVPLSLAFDAPYYLGIAVGLDPELTPRIPLAASPYGLGLRLPFSGSVVSVGPAVSIANLGGGPSLVLSGSSGDASVMLPVDAISSTEILDEPGVAGATSDATTNLGTSLTTLISRSISAPAPGYVLALGTCDMTYYHSFGTVDNITIGVSTSPTTLAANHDVVASIGSTQPTDLYTLPMSIQALFPVSAGTQTFYFLGKRTGAGMIVGDKQFNLVYFPTSYGTVSLASMPGGNGEVTPADVAAERAETERLSDERVHRELETLKAKLESLRAQLAAASPRVAPKSGKGGATR